MWRLLTLSGTPDGFQVTASKPDLDSFSLSKHMCFNMRGEFMNSRVRLAQIFGMVLPQI